MKGEALIIILFLLCFVAIIFPTFLDDAVNNTLTGTESLLIANMPLVFIVMLCAILGIYAVKEHGS